MLGNARTISARLRNSRWKSTGFPTRASFRSELLSRALCCARACRRARVWSAQAGRHVYEYSL
ncbi:hypothetical protein HMPREF0424_0407 [Gardnerella vaginalis 409-05]|nr:hypothetical protein HMPREF0424_0407 [Gardnerella vaginalis 409-05]